MGKAVRANKRQLSAVFGQMAIEYLECRDLGHSWKRLSTKYRAGKREYHASAICVTCGTERQRVLDAHGWLISTQYKYPDGYLIEGIGQLDKKERGVMRIAAMKRYIADEV